MIILIKCPLTQDCSRAGTVPATQRTSSDPALFSAPDPTHYREYIYYHMTTPYQPSQEAQDFRRSAPDPYSKLAGKKIVARYLIKWSNGEQRQEEEAEVVAATQKRKMLCKTRRANLVITVCRSLSLFFF